MRACDRPVPPRLDLLVNLLVQVGDRPRAHPRVPQRLRDVLYPPHRYPRLMREIRRRTRVVGAFPDGQSALNLAAARLRHIAGTRWSAKRYLNMKLLAQHTLTAEIA